MITKPAKFTYQKICNLKSSQYLRVNPEYQRGAVWTKKQQRMLIDSILRGYPIPVIYLHYRKDEVEEVGSKFYDIIDGQQRINAIAAFIENDYKLLDPQDEKNRNIFPEYLRTEPTPWANKSFAELSNELKDKLTKDEIHIVIIETAEDNEIRDLFIRLQGGLPLNPQEKRDAWPGGFNQLVLKLGGKSGTIYDGHDFLRKHVSFPSTDRGNLRKICAQMAMCYFERKENQRFIDVSSKSIDEYYYRYIGLNPNSEICQDFEGQLDFLYELFDDFTAGPKLKVYEVIDILLFVSSLREDYANGWDAKFLEAFKQFRTKLALSRKSEEGDYYYKYAVLTRTSSDKASTIQKRHLFFVQEMMMVMKPVKRDAQRAFSQIDREIIYFLNDGICARCHQVIQWGDLEIHHVNQHTEGGRTNLDNAAPVHKKCHPKSAKDVSEFKDLFNEFKDNQVEIRKNNRDIERRKAQSPSAYKYALQVAELQPIAHNKLTWKEVCEHLKITVGRDSGRRAFERWKVVNRPGWPMPE